MSEEILMMEVGVLRASATNPRKDFDDAEMRDLAASISGVGIQTPLVLREVPDGLESFEIVAGERRWRAAKSLGMSEVPCVVRVMSDEEVLEVQLVENVQRSQLSVLEECDGVKSLEGLGLPAAEVSRKVGRDVEWVQDRLDLCDAPGDLKEAVASGFVGIKGAKRVLSVDDEKARVMFSQDVLRFEEPLSDEDVERMIFERYEKPKEDRRKWSEWVAARKEDPEFEGVDFLENPADWSKYVRPYGDAVAPFKLVEDRVGGLAAFEADAGVAWGQLARVHGVRRLAVPVGGFQEGCGNVRAVVDRRPIEAAEKARKDAGEDFTLGAKLRGPGGGDEAEAVEDRESVGPGEGFEPVTRESVWNPWALLDFELPERCLVAARVAVDVLDGEAENWRASAAMMLGEEPGRLMEFVAEQFETILPVVIWWILREGKTDDRRLVRLASAFGVLDFWRSRMEG